MEELLEINRALKMKKEDIYKVNQHISTLENALTRAHADYKKRYEEHDPTLKELRREISSLNGKRIDAMNLLKSHETERTELEEKILEKEIERDNQTIIPSANIVRMAARINPAQESTKHQRSTENPLRRLTAQGPFYTKFDKLIRGFAGEPDALRRRDSLTGGKRKRKTKKQKKTLKRTS